MWGSDRHTSRRVTPQGTTAPTGAAGTGSGTGSGTAGAGNVPPRPDAVGTGMRGDPRHVRDALAGASDPQHGADAAELEDVEELEAELIRADLRGGASATDPLWLRLQARKLLREFLRAVPRGEAQAAISFVHPDGTAHTVTRGQLATAIDRMRPRLRQIMRLSVEERWPRQKVCEYLRGISIKTFERDQAEGLDALIDGEFQGY